MAFDGLTLHALAHELSEQLVGRRIDRIYQPEKDELILAFRNDFLLLSANREHQRAYLTQQKPETPLEPPTFCMLARKCFGAAKVVDVRQVGFDRILEIEVETHNEMSDTVRRKIVFELMGRHSNLILVDEDGRILDACFHVRPDMSRVRTVLPGMDYVRAANQIKQNPLTAGAQRSENFMVYEGVGPQLARELETVGFEAIFERVRKNEYEPTIYRHEGKMVEFSMLNYASMAGCETERFDSVSALLEAYYSQTITKNLIAQKAQDLRHLLTVHLDRVGRKLALQRKQLEDTKDREKDQKLGDLITANLYRIKPGDERVTLLDYNADPPTEVTVTLQKSLTPQQNAAKAYQRYNKQKRAAAALVEQIAASEAELADLENLMLALQEADCEQDLADLREEMALAGFSCKKKTRRKNMAQSQPIEEKTSEGIVVLIGKNNIQNDRLTFKTAMPEDLWFHAKNVPGAHVILRVGDKVYGTDYTERSIEEAARFAAVHSRGTGEVDYTPKRYVKKPVGAAPGRVHYTHQKTILIR